VPPRCTSEGASSTVASMLTVNNYVFLYLQLLNKLIVKLAIDNT